jgi:predicted dehydrogenase
MEKLGYGIIGTGMIAGLHAEVIRAVPNARLAAVYDAVPERARAFAAKHGVEAETDLARFLARPDFDAVCITTPSGARADVAVPAARDGKHLLCEKPLEVTPERADRIIEACETHGVTLACVFQARTSPAVRRIKAALDAGFFGRLVLLDVQVPWYRTQEYYDSATWRGTWALDGGGVLMNQSIHMIDLMLHFAGPPQKAIAFTDTLTHDGIEVEDSAVACLRFRNGAMGTITAGTGCAPGFPRRLELTGEHGGVVLESDRLVRWAFREGHDPGWVAQADEEPPAQDGAQAPEAIASQGHLRQIEDLTNAILEGRPPLVSGREGRRAIACICGIYQAAREGRPYVFPET